MDAGKISQHLFRNVKRENATSKGDKFKLVSCSARGVYCKDTLPEINRLYAASELARVNKEYQKSAELLQSAFIKTVELKEPGCVKCVDFFQGTITSTIENIHEEVYDMAVGFLSKKRYEQVYDRLHNFIQKVKLFEIGERNIFVEKYTNHSLTDS